MAVDINLTLFGSTHRFNTKSLGELRAKVWTLRSYRGFVHDLDYMLDPTVLDRVVCPTLIQQSRHDNSVDQEHATRVHKRITGSEQIFYDNDWRHFLWTGPGSEAAIADVQVFVARYSQFTGKSILLRNPSVRKLQEFAGQSHQRACGSSYSLC